MLKYTGGGYNGTRPELPVRDLTEEDVKELGGEEFILSTGLYEKVEDKKATKARKGAEVKYDEN